MARVTLRPIRGRLMEVGPEILMRIGPSTAERRRAAQEGRTLPEPQEVTGLIDTGARRTVIVPAVAQRCGLIQVSTTSLFVVGGGEVVAPVYSSRLEFPDGLATWEAMEVAEADLHRPDAECLIGRDILRRWEFLYDGPSGRLEITEPD
jgi:predicted aspartyl protease